MSDLMREKCLEYLENLCVNITERCTGSEGNRQATSFFEKRIRDLGWHTESFGFDAVDWEENGASLYCDGLSFSVLVSPYSSGFKGEAVLVGLSEIRELEVTDIKDKFVLLHGAIAKEQLMPKNFVFYNPEEHQRIIELLEKGQPLAIICATGRNPDLAGGVYPFPMIEDGDFNIPSVYMTEEEGNRLKNHAGKTVVLSSESKRIPGKAYNIIAQKGDNASSKIVITAHIDAKKGTPGAIDNATGVVVMLLLAELLKDYKGNKLLEIVALNGEDHYAVPGQMNYIMCNQQNFNRIILNINIDGAGYKDGPSAFSLFNLPDMMKDKILNLISSNPSLKEGIQWPQGDHSIFIQYGIPAIAVSSGWFIDNISTQDVTHTPKDNIEIVDCQKLIEIADALKQLIDSIANN